MGVDRAEQRRRFDEDAARLLSPPCAEPGGPQPALLTATAALEVRDRLDELAGLVFYDHQRYEVRDELVGIARRSLDEVDRLRAEMPTRQCMVCEDDVPVDQIIAGICVTCVDAGLSG